jgi:hypothetical protein
MLLVKTESKEKSMKRYFVMSTSMVLLSLLCGLAKGQTVNLQLIIDGPFAVCENSTNKTLTIFIPNLGGNNANPNPTYKHFISGLSTNWWEMPLGNMGVYPPYQPGVTDYKMITGEQAGPMKLKPRGSTSVVLYHEKYNSDCSNFDQTGTSVSLNVPIPDEVWPLENDQVFTYVFDATTGGLTGPAQCRTKATGCRYASKVMLRYLDVDLRNLKIYLGNTPNCSTWCPDPSLVIGTEYDITLDALPDPSATGTYKQQAEDSFLQASTLFKNLLNIQPRLGFITDIDARWRHARSNNPELYSVVTHVACQVPIIFYCQTGDGCN